MKYQALHNSAKDLGEKLAENVVLFPPWTEFKKLLQTKDLFDVLESKSGLIFKLILFRKCEANLVERFSKSGFGQNESDESVRWPSSGGREGGGGFGARGDSGSRSWWPPHKGSSQGPAGGEGRVVLTATSAYPCSSLDKKYFNMIQRQPGWKDWSSFGVQPEGRPRPVLIFVTGFYLLFSGKNFWHMAK